MTLLQTSWWSKLLDCIGGLLTRAVLLWMLLVCKLCVTARRIRYRLSVIDNPEDFEKVSDYLNAHGEMISCSEGMTDNGMIAVLTWDIIKHPPGIIRKYSGRILQNTRENRELQISRDRLHVIETVQLTGKVGKSMKILI